MTGQHCVSKGFLILNVDLSKRLMMFGQTVSGHPVFVRFDLLNVKHNLVLYDDTYCYRDVPVGIMQRRTS